MDSPARHRGPWAAESAATAAPESSRGESKGVLELVLSVVPARIDPASDDGAELIQDLAVLALSGEVLTKELAEHVLVEVHRRYPTRYRPLSLESGSVAGVPLAEMILRPLAPLTEEELVAYRARRARAGATALHSAPEPQRRERIEKAAESLRRRLAALTPEERARRMVPAQLASEKWKRSNPEALRAIARRGAAALNARPEPQCRAGIEKARAANTGRTWAADAPGRAKLAEAQRARMAALTSEQRRERCSKAGSALAGRTWGAEDPRRQTLAASMRERMAKLTPDQRRDRTRAASAARKRRKG